MKWNLSLAIAAAFMLGGCSVAKISEPPVSSTSLTHSVHTIAMDSSGGVLAEAVGIQLSLNGFNIVDANQTTNLLVRLNLSEFELATAKGLDKLKDVGIDAYMTIKGVGSYDNQLESATVRVTSTHTGQIISGLTWQNGYGCVPTSPCDRLMRKGLAETASSLARRLAKNLTANKNPK